MSYDLWVYLSFSYIPIICTSRILLQIIIFIFVVFIVNIHLLLFILLDFLGSLNQPILHILPTTVLVTNQMRIHQMNSLVQLTWRMKYSLPVDLCLIGLNRLFISVIRNCYSHMDLTEFMMLSICCRLNLLFRYLKSAHSGFVFEIC